MVCLVLKTFFNTDYRGIVQILDDCPNLCKVFELKTVPHFTTLQKATKRLMKYNITKDLLVATIRKVMGKRKIVHLAAVDATGFESGHISPYFFKHSSRSRKQHKSSKFTKWPKMAVVADTDNHLILAIAEDRGPGRDATHFEKNTVTNSKVHLR